tara:strand:+ start:877 stop:1023 length:147 start_codon:yes stop_codon:yes gene_type:complete
MSFIIAIVIIITLIILFINFLIYKRKRDAYLKAGRKWDGIVKELSKRK